MESLASRETLLKARLKSSKVIYSELSTALEASESLDVVVLSNAVNVKYITYVWIQPGKASQNSPESWYTCGFCTVKAHMSWKCSQKVLFDLTRGHQMVIS